AKDIDSGGRTGGPHVFAREGVDITSSGSGAQKLVIDIAPSSGGQQLVGIGAGTDGATPGDGQVSATVSSAGGGLLSISGATATAVAGLNISTEIGDAAKLTGGTINVTTHSWVRSKASAENDGGGLIGIGDSTANDAVWAQNSVTVDANAKLTAAGNVDVSSHSVLQPRVAAATNQGGLIGGATGNTTASTDYTTTTTFHGTISAGGTASVGAHTGVDSFANVTADVGGLGADGETHAFTPVGGNNSEIGGIPITDATTFTDLTSGSTITGNHVRVQAIVDFLHVGINTRTHATAIGANSEANGHINVGGATRVALDSGSTIVGNVNTNIAAEYLNIDL
ncbi:MAG TPA: hypothetical protein VKJ07_26040, partial [Mycobacteriales bacterium]|nr:hypothetical protein [Mycobacteriales bacterium]